MRQVWIGMSTTEIRQRYAVDNSIISCKQHLFKDAFCIGAGHCMHGIERHPEIGLRQQCADSVEIED